jgi:hypothetical protein
VSRSPKWLQKVWFYLKEVWFWVVFASLGDRNWIWFAVAATGAILQVRKAIRDEAEQKRRLEEIPRIMHERIQELMALKRIRESKGLQ